MATDQTMVPDTTATVQAIAQDITATDLATALDTTATDPTTALDTTATYQNPAIAQDMVTITLAMALSSEKAKALPTASRDLHEWIGPSQGSPIKVPIGGIHMG